MKFSTKEKLFCYYYLRLGNIKESAIQAGYPKLFAFSEGARILTSKAGQQYMSRLSDDNRCDGGELYKKGLIRLAFGSVNDAISLIFNDGDDINVDNLDLYNVSEIKRQKGGTVEIKFFDRQKALDALGEQAQNSANRSAADSFFEALKNSSKDEDGNA